MSKRAGARPAHGSVSASPTPTRRGLPACSAGHGLDRARARTATRRSDLPNAQRDRTWFATRIRQLRGHYAQTSVTRNALPPHVELTTTRAAPFALFDRL